MHEKFLTFTETLHPKFETLMQMDPVTDGILPSHIKGSGVYLFSEHGRHLYVGRTRNVRSRYGQHTRHGTGHNNAPFAFKLAREATGILKSDYKSGPTSRANPSTRINGWTDPHDACWRCSALYGTPWPSPSWINPTGSAVLSQCQCSQSEKLHSVNQFIFEEIGTSPQTKEMHDFAQPVPVLDDPWR